MVDVTTTTDGGIGSPKFELRNLADDATLTTITIATKTPVNNLSTKPNRPQSSYQKEMYNSITTPRGREVVLIRGFRLNETLVFDIVDVSTLANIKAIIGHPYKIKYYSHSDNTDRWDYVNVIGDYSYLNLNITYPFYNATLTVRGTHLRDKIPHDYVRKRVLDKVQWGLANYSVAEEERALRALDKAQWILGNFSASEELRGRVPASPGKAYKDGFASSGI